MSYMFAGATLFEGRDINDWNVSKVNNMSYMFAGATSFEGRFINNWNVSNVTNMSYMFSGATSFQSRIDGWNISGVTNFTNFMSGKTNLDYSSSNLNEIYNQWSTRKPKTGLTINFGSINYTSAGQDGRKQLTDAINIGGFGWTITDGGLV